MAAVQLSVALVSARTYLNDDAASLWTDAALIPKAQEAHRTLQTMLWKVNSPAVRKQSAAIPVTANTTTLTLPSDLLTPFRLVEYATSAETLANATEMTEQNFLPLVAPTTKLIYWQWDQENINFIGSTADRNVVVYYRKLIPVPTQNTDSIGIIFGELYIGAKTAAIAHASLGNKDAAELAAAEAQANFQAVVDAQRGQQTSPVKP